jgi:amino acid adenylation domain-containing protein
LRALGAGPGRVVAFCLDRDITLPVAALAAWQTGAAFLPLDPDHPPARWEELLRETAAVAVVTGGVRSVVVGAVAPERCAVVDVDDLEVTDGAPGPFTRPEPGDAAYVMFTSGSTGRPKGAVVTHAAIANRVCWSVAVQGLGPGDRLLAKTRIGFDAAVLEWFAPLASGATVVLAPAGVERDPAALVAAVGDSRATILQGVPSVFRAMLGERGWERCGTLRQIWSAGEPLDAALVRGLRERVDATLWNTYGPTECAIDVTAHRVPADDPSGRVPIGRPIAGVRALVLDAGHRLVPRGVAGELFIGGVAVGAGYLGRPDLTAERFVPDPYGPPGGRLYRTGDRARWRGDSLLEFVGRVDDQIKVNGVRVEPAEAGAALAAHPDVRDAVVIGAGGPDGRHRLVGYVVADRHLDPATLREDLAARVPAALIPAVFVQLDVMPRNANGKVDRAALPVPDLTAGRTSRPPSTVDEQAVAEVWADLLDVTGIGVDDDFFALGGHSLMLGQLAVRLRERTGVEVSIRDLFGGLTVRRQAALLAAGNDDGAVVPVERGGALPLSPGQRRLWFLDRLNPGSLEYLTPVFQSLPGPVDTEHVRAALNDVVARHEALRTRYVVIGEEPAQVVDPPAPVPFTEVSTVDDFATETARGFDLATGPLVRAAMARDDRGDAVLLILMHHIACDGWSTGIIAAEFAGRYAAHRAGAATPVEPAPLQYGDFAVWQNERLGTDAVTRQREHWRAALRDLPTLDLPVDRPRPPVRDPHGGVVAFEVPADLAGAVIAAGRERGASASMTLLAVFALLLSKYTGQRDVPVGVPVAGRPRPELDGVVGLFINTLVVRCDLHGDPTLADLVDRVRGTVLAAHANAEVPFDLVVDDLAPERDLSRNPLYDVLFDLHEPGYSGYLPVTAFEDTGTGSRQDLALVVQRRPDGSLAAMLEYATALFDRSTAQRVAHHYRALLERFATDPAARTTDLDLLTGAELDALRRGWTATDVALEPATLTDLLVRQAGRTPDAEAVVFDGTALTYADLHARAARLAGRLVELGAGPESVVGVALPRSLDLVVALVAVLRAGAAYLPLDPDHPPARTRALLADASPALVVTTAGNLADTAVTTVTVDEGADLTPATADPAHPAYVIYTSGSTGAPKGVVVPHAGIVNRLRWTQDRYPLTADDRVLQKTPAGFDVSVWEFFWPLTTGATLVLASPGGHRDPGYLAGLVRAERITTVHFVPSMLDTFLADPAAATCTGLRRVLCSGEALPVATRDRFHRTLSGVELHNLYGPTEASVDVTAWECRPGGSTVPIGHPVWNTRAYVLDRDLRPLPPGVPGELYLAGAQLARGYLGRPGLTAARFGPDPHGPPGTRVYRTGDRAALRTDGAVEYLGRTDDQVKIRGHRVEPGEVAAALATHPGVREAVVTAVSSAGDTHLVAYWCPSGEGGGPDLADHCGQLLPAVMVPRYFVMLDRFPLTPNGKIDRSALPAPEPVASGADRVVPRTVAEERIAEIWAELLGRRVDAVGVHDHFFRTGGHSLLAVRLSSRLAEEFDVELPLRVVFEQPTIAEQAGAVEAAIRAEIDELTDDEVAHLAVQGGTS